jgi:Domain of Unknown Function (DUF1259)
LFHEAKQIQGTCKTGNSQDDRHEQAMALRCATAKGVSRIIRALRSGRIEVVAAHDHMFDEEPRMCLSALLGNLTGGKAGPNRAGGFGRSEGTSAQHYVL